MRHFARKLQISAKRYGAALTVGLLSACSSEPALFDASPEERLMQIIDLDGDNTLNAAEYERVAQNEHDENNEIPEFSDLDGNGDEELDLTELRALLLQHSPQFDRLMLNQNRIDKKSRREASSPGKRKERRMRKYGKKGSKRQTPEP